MIPLGIVGAATPRVAPAPPGAVVSSLLHFNGADGSTSFTDEAGKVWTPSGHAQIDTSQSMFGGSSGLFDGASDYVSTPDHGDFRFADGQFTIEAFSRFTTLKSSVLACKRSASSSSVKTGWMLYTSSGGALAFVAYGGGTEVINMVHSTPFSTGTWYHIAATRDASDAWRIFIDGVKIFEQTAAAAIGDDSSPVVIGAAPYNIGSTTLNGHLDEFRITKGLAHYTEDFTRPVAPFTYP